MRENNWSRTTLFGRLGLERKKGTRPAKPQQNRSLRLEPLESRQLLTVLYWDPDRNPANNNVTTGAGLGGAGTWDTSAASWFNPATGQDVVWNSANNDTAVFSGASGAVSLSGTTAAGGVQFQTANYAIQNGTLALTGVGTVITANESGTIGANIAMDGTANRRWAIAQGKTLTVGGDVAYTGCELCIQGPGTAEFHGAVGGASSSNWLEGTSGATMTFVGSSSLTVSGIIVGYRGVGALNWNTFGSQTLTVGGLYLSYGAGSQGTLNQTAGTVVASFVNMPNGDNYNLNGGTLQTPDFHGGGATLNFGGGTLLMTGNRGVNANVSYAIADGKTAVVDTNGYNLTLYGAISGSGGLTKQGVGTLTLPGANTYTGDTKISAGTLALGNSSALGGSTLDYNSYGGTLSFGTLTSATMGGLEGAQNLALTNASSKNVALTLGGNNASTTYSGVLGGGGSLTKLGAGTLTLGAANTHTGGTTVSAGTLLLGSGVGYLATSGALAMAGGALDLGGNTQSISGMISFQTSGSEVRNGTLALTGVGTVITANESGTIGANIAMDGTANRRWAIAQGKTLTVGGDVAYTGCELCIQGPGTAEFHGAVGGASSSNWLEGTSGAAMTFVGSSSLTVSGIIVGYRGVGALNWNTFGSQTLTVGGLYLSYGAGSQGTLNQTAGTVVASFVNMPNGDNYNLNGGTLQTPDFHGGGATLNFGGGTLLMTGTFRANANMSCAIAGGKTAVVDTNGYSLTLYGAISGSGGLVKQGAGTLTLAVANTYAGGTTVNAGTLSVMGSIGAVSVNNGGTLSGTGSVGDVSVNSGGILSPGDSGGSGIGTLNTGNLTFGAGASYYADLANGTPSSDKINVTGTVNLGGANLTLRGGRTVVANEALALIQNDGTDVIGGTFSGFPEGAPLSLAGAVYAVTYQGNRDGTANDMCLASQQAPTVATPATATPSPVTGTTTVLSVLGADDGGEANLTYTWAATAFPAGATAPTFSDNGTNATKNVTATFSQAGAYTFAVTITDATGLSVASTVNVIVSQTGTTLTVTPGTVTMDPLAARLFNTNIVDQFGMPMTAAVAWSLSGSGSINATTGLYTAPASGTATITAMCGAASGTASVTVQQPYGWWKFDDNGNDSSAQTALHNATVTNATYVMGLSGSALQFNGSSSKVTFTSNPSLSSSTTNFTVGAWIKTTATAAGVIIQQRGASSGQYQLSTTAGGAVQFWLRSNSSTYQFNLTSTQTVNDGQWHFIVGVRSGTTGYIYIDGANVKSASGTTRNLSSNNAVSIGADAYGSSLWFNGTIDDARIYSSALSASVIAGMANQPPSVATPASATPSAVTGTTTNLSVLGADNSGEANCYYVWSATTLPTGAAAPTYSVNGTNAAKNTTATFSKAGTYVFTVSIYNNQSGLAAISSVSVTVSQTLTAVVVTPGSASIMSGATQQFTAAAVDQFSQSMATQPTFTWTTTVGTIDATGLLTAPTILATGTVTATAGSLSGTASVSVTTLPTPINDPELNALASTLYADGSLSRNDMMQILLKAGTDNGVVDATELADLQRIVANSTAYHMANYVAVLAGDVANGNAANAHYQGATLGNLVAGDTSTKMNNLVNKWFLGSDHPTAGYSYLSFSGSLFVGGPSYTDLYQGGLGDCYFIASMGAIAKSSPAATQNMFIDNGDNTWTVRFYSGGAADYVTVDRYLPASGGYTTYEQVGYYTSSGNELWVALAEKAYAQWNETGKEGRDGLNSYPSIEGGWTQDVCNQVLNVSSTTVWWMPTNQKQTLIDGINAGKAVTYATNGSPGDGLYGPHAYVVLSYSVSTDTFQLYNPWGSSHPGPLTYTQLYNNGQCFVIADTSGTTPPSSGGVAAPADGSAVAPIMTAIFAPLAPPQTGTPLVQSATAAAVMDCEPLHAALPRLESIAATCDATAQLLKTSLRSTSSTLRAVDLWFDEIGANGDGASLAHRFTTVGESLTASKKAVDAIFG